MKKIIEFTQEQKSLIWNTKVVPNNGTQEDAKLFLEVCEMHGLNPLVGDIVFNRYETKRGPVVNFITTRDGYLKAAQRDPSFVRIASAVVKEGDHFKFDAVNGSVEHGFGTKRGNILGAWAVAVHKERGAMPVFVDFDEYFKANAQSQNGRSPIWDNMPSAMIQKVAEVFVLRRQFPLGGIVAAEEMGIEDDSLNQIQSNSEEPKAETITKPTKVERKKETKAEESVKKETPAKKKKSDKKADTKQAAKKSKDTSPLKVVEDQKSNAAKVEKDKKAEEKPAPKNESEADSTTQQADPSESEKESKTEQTDSVEEKPSQQKWKLIKADVGQTPNKVPFLKAIVENNQTSEQMLVLAKDEDVHLLDEVAEGQSFDMEYRTENGYNFLVKVS